MRTGAVAAGLRQAGAGQARIAAAVEVRRLGTATVTPATQGTLHVAGQALFVALQQIRFEAFHHVGEAHQRALHIDSMDRIKASMRSRVLAAVTSVRCA